MALSVPTRRSSATATGSGTAPSTTPSIPRSTPTMYAVGVRTSSEGAHPALLASRPDACSGSPSVAAALALLDRCAPRWLSFPVPRAAASSRRSSSRRLESLLADQTLAYFVALAALACVLWLRERRAAWLVLVVILMRAPASLTKLEGETYALLLALIIVAGTLLRRRFTTATRRPGARSCGPAAIEPWRHLARPTTASRPPPPTTT